MGILDEALKQFTQGGGNAQQQPLIVVLQELLVGKPQQPGVRQASQQQEAEVPQSSAAPQTGAGGLGGLLAQLQAAGLDDAVRSGSARARISRCSPRTSATHSASAP